MSDAHQIRSCIFCRKKDNKRDLLRFVVDEEGKLVWDQKQRMPGRGAYMHKSMACWQQSARLAHWTRALRIAGGKIDAASLEAVREQVRSFLIKTF